MFYILKFCAYSNFEESFLVKFGISPLLGYSSHAEGDADSVISQYKQYKKFLE